MAVAGGPNTSESGLVLCLDAGNPRSYQSGSTTWFDLSGNGYTGSLTNGPTFSTGSIGAVVFDGIDDNVNFGDIPGVDQTFAQTSIIIWASFPELPPTYTFLLGKMGGPGNRGFQLAISSSAKLEMGYFNSPSGSYVAVTSSGTVQTNRFIQIAYSFVASTSDTFYLNGALDSVQTTSVGSAFNGSNSNNFQLGQRGDNVANGYFKGSIALAQIYNRALSAQEVKQNYDALKTRFQ